MQWLRNIWRGLNDPTVSLRRAFSRWAIIFLVTVAVLLLAAYLGSGGLSR